MEKQRVDEILKAMKGIKPEDGFVSRSKQMIFATQQNPMRFGLSFMESFKLGAALALASIMLFVALGGLSYLGLKNSSPSLLTSLNSENLKAEAEKLDFQIQLGQAKYNLGNQTEVGVNVDEILKNLSL